FVFSMFYGETIVTKTIDYQASFLILNGTAVNVRLNIEDVFLIISEKPVRHGFYVNQIVECDNVESAIEQAKCIILDRIKHDSRIIRDNYEFNVQIDNVEILSDVNSIENNQGLVWYKQESLDS
ncbi:MAG: hypothetical protein AB2563_02350, partial [Candidatus Thiodiazotropha endolucinida]